MTTTSTCEQTNLVEESTVVSSDDTRARKMIDWDEAAEVLEPTDRCRKQQPHPILLGAAASARNKASKRRHTFLKETPEISDSNQQKFRGLHSRKRRRNPSPPAGLETESMPSRRHAQANKLCDTETLTTHVELASATLASLWQATQLDEIHALLRSVGEHNILGDSNAAKQLRELCKCENDAGTAESDSAATRTCMEQTKQSEDDLAQYSRAELEKKTHTLQSVVCDLVRQVKNLQQNNLYMMSQMQSAQLGEVSDEPVVSELIKELAKNKQKLREQKRYLNFQLQVQAQDAGEQQHRAWVLYSEKLNRLEWQYRCREEDMKHHHRLLQRESFQRWTAAVTTINELLTRHQVREKLDFWIMNSRASCAVGEAGVPLSQRNGAIAFARMSKVDMIEKLLMLRSRQQVPDNNARLRHDAKPVSAMPSRNDKLGLISAANTSHLGQSIAYAKVNSARVLPASASRVDTTTMQTMTHQTTVSSHIAKANDALIDKRQQWMSSTRKNVGITRDAPHLQSQYNDSMRQTGITGPSIGGHSVVKQRENGMQVANHARRGVSIAITEKPDPVPLAPTLVSHGKEFLPFSNTFLRPPLKGPVGVTSVPPSTWPMPHSSRYESIRHPEFKSKASKQSPRAHTTIQSPSAARARLPEIIDITSEVKAGVSSCTMPKSTVSATVMTVSGASIATNSVKPSSNDITGLARSGGHTLASIMHNK